MPRIQFSDVTPPEKRSIRNIPIPSGGKRKVPIVIRPPQDTPPPKEEILEPRMSEVTEKKETGPYEYYYPKEKPKKKKFIFGGIAVALVAVFVFGMMTVFASATVTIIPKIQTIPVDMKVDAVNEIEEGTVKYEIIKLSKSKTVSVKAAGEEAVELKASGKIVIYNNFSNEPQRLITRTRFESPEGFIYRIGESAIVPGKSVKNGAEVPGSVEVEVFADEAGEKYNLKKTDFTIPGFKNDAVRFKNFYARSATEMSGGFVGKRKTVSQSEKEAALQNIDSEIKADLQKELATKIPEELVILSNSIVYEPKELPQKEEISSVEIGKEITAYAIILNKQDLSQKIVSQYVLEIPEWNDIAAKVKDFSPLTITNLPTNLENTIKLELQIKGQAEVLADIDTNIISQRLSGRPKNELSNLIDEFSGISKITAAVRPVWKRSFPKSPAKIYTQIDQNI